MDLSFWLGKYVWDTHVVLWQKFGGSILDIYGVMRIARLDATIHRRCRPRLSGLSAVSTRTVCAALAAALVASSFLIWGFNSSNNCSILLMLIQIHDL
jgi:hypothetical protein